MHNKIDTDFAMSGVSEINPPWRPISSRMLAPLLGVSLQSLANWRVRGYGPPYEGLQEGKGNKIFYRPDKVLSWLSQDACPPWHYCRDWLLVRKLDVHGGLTEEAVEWMAMQLDAMDEASRGVK